MKEENLKNRLNLLVEMEIPSKSVNLWPQIKERIERREPKYKLMHFIPLKSIVFGLSLVLMAFILIFISPQFQVWADEFMLFFVKSENDVIEMQPGDDVLVTNPTGEKLTKTPEPSSILNASEDVLKIENQLNFQILKPTWIPETVLFKGANYDAEENVFYLFYEYIYVETNGLVIRQEPVDISGECVFCSKVGASSIIETVMVGAYDGQYIQGVWKFDKNGDKFWDNDPYLQRLRWQTETIAFELMYMGPSDTLSMEEMIRIAENLN